MAVTPHAMAADAAPRRITVFAAASLKTVLDKAATAFTAKSGTVVTASYAASSALAKQIEQGAPADLFISADVDWMDYVASKSLIDPATRTILAGNTLVLVSQKEKPAAIAIAPGFDLATALGNGRLAVAETASVPAGKYAKAALERLGVWASVRERLAQAENVRAALALVALGEAPLGIVYGSDAAAEPRVAVAATFPEDSHTPIVYPAAVIAASPAPEPAAAFLQYLRSDEARALFAENGFKPAG